jgi:spore coat protein U-like protein
VALLRRERTEGRRILGALVGGCLVATPMPRTLHAADCSASATSVMFGIYDAAAAAPNDSTGTLTVTCTYTPSGDRSILYTVGLNSGNGTSAAVRWLASGNDRLYYNLFIDPARLLIWGDGTAGAQLASGSLKVGPGVGNGTRSEKFTVYGRMPARQDANAGDYRDTIVFTLTF